MPLLLKMPDAQAHALHAADATDEVLKNQNFVKDV